MLPSMRKSRGAYSQREPNAKYGSGQPCFNLNLDEVDDRIASLFGVALEVYLKAHLTDVGIPFTL